MIASVAGPVVKARPDDISAIAPTIQVQYEPPSGVSAATMKPLLISSSPNATTSFVPVRLITIIATGENAAVMTANGNVASPASSGL